MPAPTFSSEGFRGERWIVDDYFTAGHALHAGDVVCVRDSGGSSSAAVPRGAPVPRVYKVSGEVDKRRVIGIVHTPANRDVGDSMASSGEYVPIVVLGIAKALSTGSMAIGEPLIASGDKSTAPDKTVEVATLVASPSHNHSVTPDGKTGEGESDREALVHTVAVEVVPPSSTSSSTSGPPNTGH